mmetsp:Transcript_19325/g.55400  ORF Transcript_19325/g.55400 Transcript_19325/m.55400 type:complete len:222 (+) Transcript_19325:316-981(+)
MLHHNDTVVFLRLRARGEIHPEHLDVRKLPLLNHILVPRHIVELVVWFRGRVIFVGAVQVTFELVDGSVQIVRRFTGPLVVGAPQLLQSCPPAEPLANLVVEFVLDLGANLVQIHLPRFLAPRGHELQQRVIMGELFDDVAEFLPTRFHLHAVPLLVIADDVRTFALGQIAGNHTYGVPYHCALTLIAAAGDAHTEYILELTGQVRPVMNATPVRLEDAWA